jgi:hypothetical protein
MCNGLFTSHRSLAQVFAQELAYLAAPRFEPPLGHADAGPYSINNELKSVTVGTNAPAASVSAVFLEGFGCAVLPPGVLPTIEAKNNLPRHPMADKPLEASHRPWPEGDLITPSIPEQVNRTALAQAASWSFQRPSAEQVTISLLVVYQGQLILEQYAQGFDQTTRTRTWSTAKSIAVTLLGMLVDAGELTLDSPLSTEQNQSAPCAEYVQRTRPSRQPGARIYLRQRTGLLGWRQHSARRASTWSGATAR